MGMTRVTGRDQTGSYSDRPARMSMVSATAAVTTPTAISSQPSASLDWAGTTRRSVAISGKAKKIRVCAARPGSGALSRICRRLMDTATNSSPVRVAAAVAAVVANPPQSAGT